MLISGTSRLVAGRILINGFLRASACAFTIKAERSDPPSRGTPCLHGAAFTITAGDSPEAVPILARNPPVETGGIGLLFSALESPCVMMRAHMM